jgi:cell division septum initiation protein DivIVA
MSDDMGELVEDMQAERSEAESEVIRLRADLEKMTGERAELRSELEAASIRRLNNLDELHERLRIAVAEREVALRDRNDARRDFEAMRGWRDFVVLTRDDVRRENRKLRAQVADLTEQLAGHVQQHAIEAECLAEAKRENAQLREALTKCANLTRHQENSPSTVWEVGLRVNAIVAAALARKDGG